MELHLFIIWNNASNLSETIISDISRRFDIVRIENILWDQDAFSSNLSRFYGQNLPNASSKVEECGTGRFQVIIVADNSPSYDVRKTSKGMKLVNINLFDAKTYYRNLTGGGHKVHSTNDVSEARHDILLITHQTYDHLLFDFNNCNNHDYTFPIINSEKNLLGYIQWDSLEQLFQALNQSIDYVVLRNFDCMPTDYYVGDHGDIDLLVRNKTEAEHLINATKLFNMTYRVHSKVNISYRTVRFDIRYLGDNYYDAKWQEDILSSKIIFNNIYVPNHINYKYSLLYHAVVHKKIVAKDYQDKLKELGFESKCYVKSLKDFMNVNEYKITEPQDLSVYYNNKSIGQSESYKRFIYFYLKGLYKSLRKVKKQSRLWIKNEIRKITT
jgi:hypothetical protein